MPSHNKNHCLKIIFFEYSIFCFQPDASFVYYTGDIISHRVWSTSVEKNTRDLIEIYELLDTYFDVPVYPVLGNHEPHPLNV